MHRTTISLFIIAVIGLASFVSSAHGQSEESQAVVDGGISAPGWSGRIDAKEAEAGQILENAKLSQSDGMLLVTTGPATTYWKAENAASGNYTVMATFNEPAYMNLGSHPHPYGIVIGGSEMGTAEQSFLYCAAYGNGTFIVRGFGPEPFQVNGRRGEANDAINKADEEGAPVTQAIAVTVTDDSVQCSINGTIVGSYPKSEIVGAGKLKSTDGVYGIRFGHNTEGTVTGLHSMD